VVVFLGWALGMCSACGTGRCVVCVPCALLFLVCVLCDGVLVGVMCSDISGGYVLPFCASHVLVNLGVWW